jgi:chromosome segregation ATPase
MIQDTLEKIEARLQNAESLTPDKRAELSTLLATLKQEVAELHKTNADEATSIAGFTELSAHEATRVEKNPVLLQHSLEGLKGSVDGFEESHPRLVQSVNAICTTLSNLGI